MALTHLNYRIETLRNKNVIVIVKFLVQQLIEIAI